MSGVGFWRFDLATRRWDRSRTWTDGVGASDDAGPDDLGFLSGHLHPDDAAATLHAFRALLERPRADFHHEYRLLDTDGRVHYVVSKASPVEDDRGRVVAIQGVDVDVSHTRSLAEDVDTLRNFDPLTGLSNAYGFTRRVDTALAFDRKRNRMSALIIVGLEGLQVLNDSYGHAFGDAVLHAVAKRLGTLIRPEDALGRFRSVRFALLVTNLRATREIDDVVTNVRAGLSRTLEVEGERLRMDVSLGVAIAPQDGDRADVLLERAETALHAAKATAPGTVRYDDEELQRAAIERTELRNALVEAIEGGRIDVALQPIVRLRDGALVGVEALARWTDAALGAIPPRRFVDEAERSLLIRSLGRAVRAAAYRAADRVAAETGTEVRVALNVSARELSDPTLATVVTSELRRIGWTPERLELEVTETAAITDDDVVHANLTALRSTGVRVAIDDFGTGYASLEQLQRIPADVLKIDRAFVTPLGGDDASATALVRATVQIGRAFGLEVLAEGVETEAQWEALAQIGCDLAQGFLVAPPMDLASFLGWWSARRATVGNAVTR